MLQPQKQNASKSSQLVRINYCTCIIWKRKWWGGEQVICRTFGGKGEGKEKAAGAGWFCVSFFIIIIGIFSLTVFLSCRYYSPLRRTPTTLIYHAWMNRTIIRPPPKKKNCPLSNTYLSLTFFPIFVVVLTSCFPYIINQLNSCYFCLRCGYDWGTYGGIRGRGWNGSARSRRWPCCCTTGHGSMIWWGGDETCLLSQLVSKYASGKDNKINCRPAFIQ